MCVIRATPFPFLQDRSFPQNVKPGKCIIFPPRSVHAVGFLLTLVNCKPLVLRVCRILTRDVTYSLWITWSRKLWQGQSSSAIFGLVQDALWSRPILRLAKMDSCNVDVKPHKNYKLRDTKITVDIWNAMSIKHLLIIERKTFRSNAPNKVLYWNFCAFVYNPYSGAPVKCC